ncbi:hypothetical protein Gpo141_00006033 [Globisporangium polare]
MLGARALFLLVAPAALIASACALEGVEPSVHEEHSEILLYSNLRSQGFTSKIASAIKQELPKTLAPTPKPTTKPITPCPTTKAVVGLPLVISPQTTEPVITYVELTAEPTTNQPIEDLIEWREAVLEAAVPAPVKKLESVTTKPAVIFLEPP